MSQWFEKEDFWLTFAPIMFDQNRWQEAPTVANYIVNFAALKTKKNPSSVLDAGCGIGRITTELGLLGLNVTGVDIIQSELDLAKETATEENLNIEYINADLRKFCAKEKYDCVINLYTSFGYCDDIKEDLLILKNMCNSVKKGGTFIMECTSREIAILHFTQGEEFERAGYKVKTNFNVSGAWEGLISNWQLYKTNQKITKNTKPLVNHTFTQRLYPATYLQEKILQNGFSTCKIFGDWDKRAYDQHAKTMLLVAQK